MNERYEAWNRALVDEYFPEGGRGQLAYLPIDDDELHAMAEPYGLCKPAEAVNDFVAMIRAELAARNDSFVRFSAGVKGWRRVRDDPPYIAGLAFCVLAASRMETDQAAGVASHNYYTQLNRLLGRNDRAGAPRGFETLDDAWQDLAIWLDRDCAGSRGSSTIRTRKMAGKHVGYPLSQCLLRACDRRRLPDFFRSAGLQPTTKISSSRLFTLLRAWAAQPSCGLTARARNAIANAEDIDVHEIAETVARELAVWDGELRDARGRRRAGIHLLVIPRRRGTVVKLLARRPEGFPDGSWMLERSPHSVELQPNLASNDWYAPLDLDISKKVLDSGLRLVHGDVALTFEPASAIPCRQATPEIGGYISQPQATMWEPHIAIVRRPQVPDLKAYLGHHVERPVEMHPSGSNLPAEWAITQEFQFIRPSVAAPAEFSRLAPRLIATTAFEGGLPLSSAVYLTKGEPDVHVAVEPGATMSVQLDGVEQHLDAGALNLELSAMRLPPGRHTFVADITRSFSTVETFGDACPPESGTLGHRLSRHRSYHPETASAERLGRDPSPGDVHLAGAVASGAAADLPLGDRRPHLFRAGARRYALIGAVPGQVARPAGTLAPSWLRAVGLGDFFQFIEIHADFDPAWLLVEGSTGARNARMLSAVPPAAQRLEGAITWASLISQWEGTTAEEGAQEAWARYVEAARQLASEHVT
jgi:hypothetical protein